MSRMPFPLLAVAASALGLAMVSGPAQADYYGWGGGPGWHHHCCWGPPVIVAPAPPPPVVYVQPAPTVVYQSPAPMSADQASPTFTDSYGRTCREYQSTIYVNGAPRPAYGTACLMPDGMWRVVN